MVIVVVGIVKIFFIVVGICVVDRFGRRVLLFTSMGGMFFLLIAFGISFIVIDRNLGYTFKWVIVFSVIMVMTFVVIFLIGVGLVTWVYCLEIFFVRLRV